MSRSFNTPTAWFTFARYSYFLAAKRLKVRLRKAPLVPHQRLNSRILDDVILFFLQ
jgi:uncharacterized membrane protein